jgi:adhesin transport system membrane fusion protein
LVQQPADPLVPLLDGDDEYVTDTSFAALQGARPQAHWILWGSAGCVLIALMWAGVAKLDEVTVGQGQVIPSSKVQVVQNLEGGIVSEILVEPGQVVRRGQSLMRIDDKRFSSSYLEGDAKDAALRARIARLSAEASLKPFTPPPDLEQAKPELVRQEREVYESRRRDFDAGLGVLQRQAEQRSQELAEMEARVSRLEDSLELVQQELEMMRPAAEKGVVSRVELIRLERQANDLTGELEVARLSVPRLRAAEREVKQRAEQYVADFRAQASREMSEARADQSVVSATKVALEDRLDRTLVRAPVAGTVKQVKVNTVGGVVQPGMDLVEIVPIEDTLLVEARIRPSDIAFLRPGLPAMVKLSAYDFSIYGGIEGTVEHISADAIVDERPGTRGESYYIVRVRTQHANRGAGERHLKIIPGMQATVDIRTGRKTVLQYLLKPILRAKQTALRER